MKYSAKETNGTLNFQLTDVDKSFANALRRTLLGNIPIQVMKPEDCIIHSNTSRFTNEMIKLRLSCIPIHEPNITKSLTISCNVRNDTSHTIHVTTEAFQQPTLFPPITVYKKDRYIEWLRLRPEEEISFTCKTSVGTANQCGAYNSVGTCSYGFTKDKEASNRAWGEQPRQTTKEDWDCLDSKRYVVPRSFDFILESIGVFTNQELLLLASSILILQLEQCMDSLTITPSVTTIENCFDVALTGDYSIQNITIPMQGDYTIGKLLEYELYQQFMEKKITYVAFFKSHPHDTVGILRVASKNATAEDIRTMVKNASLACIETCQAFIKLIR